MITELKKQIKERSSKGGSYAASMTTRGSRMYVPMSQFGIESQRMINESAKVIEKFKNNKDSEVS